MNGETDSPRPALLRFLEAFLPVLIFKDIKDWADSFAVTHFWEVRLQKPNNAAPQI